MPYFVLLVWKFVGYILRCVCTCLRICEGRVLNSNLLFERYNMEMWSCRVYVCVHAITKSTQKQWPLGHFQRKPYNHQNTKQRFFKHSISLFLFLSLFALHYWKKLCRSPSFGKPKSKINNRLINRAKFMRISFYIV